jgi:predicted NBD/HSP70 family sugar kinase
LNEVAALSFTRGRATAEADVRPEVFKTMTTIRDVANLAEVSIATVSHVVNNSRRVAPDTRTRVERAIDELGFRPDQAGRALARRKGGGGAERPDADEGARDSARARNEAPNGDTAVALLRLVRAAQPVSRADIARRLCVHRSSVTGAVKPLLAEGVLRETATPAGEEGVTRMGRPGTGLELTDGRCFVGLNLGVRQSHAGAVTAGGRMLAEAVFDTPPDAAEALRLMRSTIEDLRARVRGRALFSVGVSVPGPTCAERRRLLYAPHLGWRDVDVAGALAFARDTDACVRGAAPAGESVPVLVENDARAAALYEARARSAEEGGDSWRDFILVRAGTGVGVGVVRGGEVYRGSDAADGWAGEFGHMTIVADGRRCACGGRGCWESYASTGSAVALYTGERAAWRGRAPRFVEIVARAEAGEARARSTLERVGGYLGIGVANLIVGLGVSRVVVSGRLVHGWKFMSGPLREAVGRGMAGRLSEWTVEAGCATGAGLGGALEVAIDHYLTTAARTSLTS